MKLFAARYPFIHSYINSAVAPVAMAPADQTYSRGDNITLQCTSMGGPENAFQWLFDGEALAGENSSTLLLLNADAADGGTYSCMVSNAAGNSRAGTSVFIAPYFITQPVDTVSSNGTVVILMCVAEASPSPQYQWSRGDSGAIRNGIDTSTSALTFEPVMFGDEGDYICTARAGDNSTQSNQVTITSNKIAMKQTPHTQYSC